MDENGPQMALSSFLIYLLELNELQKTFNKNKWFLHVLVFVVFDDLLFVRLGLSWLILGHFGAILDLLGASWGHRGAEMAPRWPQDGPKMAPR